MLDAQHAAAPHGDRLVLALELAVCRYAWPVWLRCWPDESWPIELVARLTRERWLSGVAHDDDGMLDNLQAELDDRLLGEERYFSSVCAGWACLTAGHNAVRGACWLHDEPDKTDLELDPWSWDPAGAASIAVAGGAVWQDVGSDDLRRDFWTWFAQEALPTAAQAAAGPVPPD